MLDILFFSNILFLDEETYHTMEVYLLKIAAFGAPNISEQG